MMGGPDLLPLFPLVLIAPSFIIETHLGQKVGAPPSWSLLVSLVIFVVSEMEQVKKQLTQNV